MKRKIFFSFLGLTAAGMLLAACNGGRGNVDPSQDIPDLDVAKKVVDYTAGTGKDKVFASSGYGNGDPFNVTWNAANVVEGDKQLNMKITDAPDGNEYPYYGGELRSLEFFGYGDFGVRMKPAKTGGTASTFFLYTGEWDSETLHPSTGETDTKNPKNAEGKHDEIDIEFLGKDTTKVQFNYFTSGQGGNEYMYDLGFDASEEWHTYGFRWEKDRITWFVDLKPVYTATKNIPTHPGRMISNFWTGSDAARMWMGDLDKANLHDASYQWLSSSVQGEETHKEPEPGPTPGTVIDWDEIEAVELSDVQGNTETYSYELSEDNKSMEVTYENVGQNYNNLNVAIPESYSESRVLSFEVENKGTAPVAVRGNANAATTHGTNNIYAVNYSATQDGVAVTTDLEWGGSMFNIQPGATSLCEITYSEAITRLEWMIDSHISGEQSGNIVIKNLKFAGDEVEPIVPPTPAEPTKPADVTDAEAVVLSDVQGNVGAGATYNYLLSDDGKAMNVVYTNVGQNYNNVNVAVPAGAAESRKLTFKVTNNGENAVSVRGNANAATTHGTNNIYAVNVSAKQDGTDVSTDLEWGGSFFTIAAGATSVCEITYSEAITRLEWMIDSHVAGNQSGDVTISTLKFDGYDPASEPVEPEPEDDPFVPATPADITDADAVALSDVQGNVGEAGTYQYLLSSDSKAINIAYNGVAQNYNNVNVAIPTSAAGSRTLSFKVTNNGTAAVAVRGNANAATTHGDNNIYAVNVSAKQDGTTVNTDLSWGGSFFVIQPGATAVCEITYSEAITRLEWMIDSHVAGTQSGNVTISTLKFAAPADPGEGEGEGEGEGGDTPEVIVPTTPADVTDTDAVALTDIQGNVGADATYQYLLSSDTKAINIAYNGVAQNYNNVNVAIPTAAAESRTLSFVITNNGEATVAVRGNANASTTHGTNNIYAVNVSAKQDGVAVTTDLDWGGSMFSVPAGETVVCEITYSEAITRLEWMIDSHVAGTQSGNITISTLKFVAPAEPEPAPEPEPEPEPTPEPEPSGDDPVIPTSVDWTALNPVALDDLKGNTDTYTTKFSENKVNVDVKYTEVGQNYHNINFAVPSDAANSRALSFKVTNKGTAAVTVRGNANGTTQHGEHNIVAENLSAKQDGVEVSTDLSWGGSYFSIPAGQTVLCEITYSASITRVEFMIDSTTEATESGHIVIGELKFNGVERDAPEAEKSVIPEDPEPTPDPEPDPEPAVLSLNFTTNATYTAAVDAENGKTTIGYESVQTDTYALISATITDAPAGPKAISFSIKNTAEHDSTVAFDLLDSSNKHICVVADYDYFDFNGGNNRAQFHLTAGATRTLVIAYVGELAKIDLYYDTLWADESHTESTDGSLEISNVTYVDHSVITLGFTDQGGYTCTSANGSTHITYEGGADASYQNVWLSLEGIAPAGKNTMAINVTNNATDHTLKIMVQLGGVTGDKFIDVAASSTGRLVMALGEATPTSICVFIDSTNGGTRPAGDIIISNVYFYNVD